MGWASGSSLMDGIISAIKGKVPDYKTRKEIYKAIINEMESADWDTQDECMGSDKAYDAALKSLHPNWYEED